MGNIAVLIFVESRYKVERKRIREKVLALLNKQGIEGPSEISIAIIGNRKMRELSKKYKNEDKTRSILSFSLTEGETSALPQDTLRLGDLVISYPEVIREAGIEEMLVYDKIDELIEHGLNHLLGIHSEE